MDEVVVIGYGTARKIDLTGSTASLGGDKLQMKNTPQLANQLQGQMAGVQVTRSTGDQTLERLFAYAVLPHYQPMTH